MESIEKEKRVYLLLYCPSDCDYDYDNDNGEFVWFRCLVFPESGFHFLRMGEGVVGLV